MDIDKYIDILFENQNIGADKNQKNLKQREYYLKLLKNVIGVLKDNKDLSIEELRQKLYDKSKLEEFIRYFFLEKNMAPGAVITYGTKNFQERITIGNKQEVVMKNGILVPQKEEMQENTIFDLASVTKLFTAISILKLVQDGELNINDEVTKYVPEFKNLKGITILELLTFEPLVTTGKVDSTEDMSEAENILFSAKRQEDIKKGDAKYNDIAPMVLKYVIEKISGITYQEFVQKEILDKLGMSNTFVQVPDEKKDMVANSNYDLRIDNNSNFIVRTNAIKGVSTDDKARILGQPKGILSGHAGLFSSSSDMTKLARALVDNQILNLEIRDEMIKNRRGKFVIDANGKKNFSQYFGMLVYSKNPNPVNTEVRHFLSGKSFASAGWSGTQQTIDPINNLNLTFLSNRSHNRLTSIAENQKYRIIHNDNVLYNSVISPYGEFIDASRYAYERDDVITKCMELALEYKMLEDIVGYSKNNDKVDENSRVIK